MQNPRAYAEVGMGTPLTHMRDALQDMDMEEADARQMDGPKADTSLQTYYSFSS